MQPQELENRLREFLGKEMNGSYYQCVVSFTDGKPDPANPMSIKVGLVSVSNANPNSAPFSVLHGLMKALKMHFKNMQKGLYGGELRQDDEEGLPGRYF